MENIQLATIKTQHFTQAEALAWFDSLPTVKLEKVTGLWKGTELSTGHPLEGLLTACGWYGKYFKNPEEVHPLVMEKCDGHFYMMDPARLPLVDSLEKVPRKVIERIRGAAPILLQTKKSGARLREINYRGQVTTAMIYDKKAIIDVFRQVDDHTLLGLMDIKEISSDKKFYFILEKMVRK